MLSYLINESSLQSNDTDKNYYLSTIAIISSVCAGVIIVITTLSIVVRYKMRHAVILEKNQHVNRQRVHQRHSHGIILEMEKNTIV